MPPILTPVAGRSRRIATALALGLALAAGCTTEPEAAIERETFVATWVDLRRAAMASPDVPITPSERERILSEHGVTDQELLDFAEVHGGDVPYMAQVWEEVEARMGGTEAAGDSTGGG